MRGTELLRLVWLNINQNKFKSVMTSIGIIVGAATIMLVIGIGQGGQMDIAEQFAELNAGEINVSYEYEEETSSTGSGGMFGAIGNFFGDMMGGFPGGEFSGGGSGGRASGGMPFGGDFSGDGSGGSFKNGGVPGESGREKPDFSDSDFSFDENNPFVENSLEKESETEGETETENESDAASELLEERLNQRSVILTQDDVDDIEAAVSNITGATISYTVQSSIEGGKLLSEKKYTVAGTKEAFEEVSRLQMEEGNFLNEAQDNAKTKVCVLGSSAAKELFGSAEEAMD